MNSLQYLATEPNSEFPGIPGRNGLPLIGDAISFVRDSLAFQRKCYEEFGPVFYTRMGPEYNVMLVHPDAARLVTLDTEQNFSARLGYENSLGNFFPNGLLLKDFSDHKMHRRIMQSAFKNERLESYVPLIHTVVRQHVDEWQKIGEVTFVDAIKSCLLEVGSRVFLGMEIGEDADTINRHFVSMANACTTPIRANIPGTPYSRGVQGYRYISNYFRNHIAAKRNSLGTDMFTLFCKETDENGHYYSDDDIVHHVNFLLFAAHDTTTSTLSSMMYEFVKHPEIMQACRDELLALDQKKLSYADLAGLDNCTWSFKETLRLYPPVNGIARRCIREFEFQGYTIPSNTMVVVPNLLIMRLPEFFSDPDTFDPQRFAPGREEHKRHTFAWSPFGGGAHKCIGLHFADMLVKVVLFELLRTSTIESTKPMRDVNRDFAFMPFPKPRNHLPLRIRAVN